MMRHQNWSDLRIKTEILDWLDSQGGLARASEVSQALRVPAQRVKVALEDLVKTGEVKAQIAADRNGEMRRAYMTVLEPEPAV